ncbi:hypothetical protein Ae406Ps2_6097c [Pseudonocardia sp. Ae406_Ps2]|nr:hypothetical protein Ae406Ps2_6097c [Pseudonocardia sp. Ae406_Ps2]OLM08640.1 hypothetical protein Ae505Ps2_6027c [Pseudonocardia sp. Ae505_Ps2]
MVDEVEVGEVLADVAGLTGGDHREELAGVDAAAALDEAHPAGQQVTRLRALAGHLLAHVVELHPAHVRRIEVSPELDGSGGAGADQRVLGVESADLTPTPEGQAGNVEDLAVDVGQGVHRVCLSFGTGSEPEPVVIGGQGNGSARPPGRRWSGVRAVHHAPGDQDVVVGGEGVAAGAAVVLDVLRRAGGVGDEVGQDRFDHEIEDGVGEGAFVVGEHVQGDPGAVQRGADQTHRAVAVGADVAARGQPVLDAVLGEQRVVILRVDVGVGVGVDVDVGVGPVQAAVGDHGVQRSSELVLGDGEGGHDE